MGNSPIHHPLPREDPRLPPDLLARWDGQLAQIEHKCRQISGDCERWETRLAEFQGRLDRADSPSTPATPPPPFTISVLVGEQMLDFSPVPPEPDPTDLYRLRRDEFKRKRNSLTRN